MQSRIFSKACVLMLTVLFSRCAQIGPLTGGNRDVTPPKLKQAIPANKTTNFHEQEIQLVFDEYIKLNDVANQINILPQMKLMPEFEVHGKTIKIKLLQQVFDPGITYRIDFGKAIADMHEGNVLENFAYIFSTGAFVDSLRISGNVSNAFNNKSMPGVAVMLYQNNQWYDSLIFKTKASYIVKTNSNGDFVCNNLAPSRYLVYAIDDKNKNSLYDGESEQVAMLGPPMDLMMDTVADLKMFKEESPKSYIKKSNINSLGYGQLILNKAAALEVKPVKLSAQDKFMVLECGRLSDTTIFLFKGNSDTLNLAIKQVNGNLSDTLHLAVPKSNNSKNLKLGITINDDQGYLPYKQNAVLNFHSWMDTSKVQLSHLHLSSKTDSAIQSNIKLRWHNVAEAELVMNLKEGHLYTLKIDKGAFVNLAGISHDSLSFQFKTHAKSDFGRFNLKLSVTRQQNYVLHLMNEREEIVQEKTLPYTAFKAGLANVSFNDVMPGVYAVKIIFDNNENKKWDRGDANTSRLPEPVIISRKRIKIVADWETEEQINLGEK